MRKYSCSKKRSLHKRYRHRVYLIVSKCCLWQGIVLQCLEHCPQRDFTGFLSRAMLPAALLRRQARASLTVWRRYSSEDVSANRFGAPRHGHPKDEPPVSQSQQVLPPPGAGDPVPDLKIAISESACLTTKSGNRFCSDLVSGEQKLLV